MPTTPADMTQRMHVFLFAGPVLGLAVLRPTYLVLGFLTPAKLVLTTNAAHVIT